jgi:hypothetical protein
MLTLTSKTRFGVMRGCQEQTREGDLGGSPGFGWTERPKTDNILLVGWGVTLRMLAVIFSNFEILKFKMLAVIFSKFNFFLKKLKIKI